MKRGWFFLLLLAAPAVVEAEEHQRLAAAPSAQRWEAGLEGSLTPLAYGWWAASVSPRVGYEWERTLSFSLSQPFSWLSDPGSRSLRATRGGTSLDLGWSGGGDLQMRLTLGLDFPDEAAQGGGWRGETGLSVVRDPVIVGGSLGITVPDSGTYLQGSGSLFFQEVANDRLSWSLVFSPQWTWAEGVLFWTVSVAWHLAWYEGPYSLSSGVSAGSGLPWAWSASAGRAWPR